MDTRLLTGMVETLILEIVAQCARLTDTRLPRLSPYAREDTSSSRRGASTRRCTAWNAKSCCPRSGKWRKVGGASTTSSPQPASGRLAVRKREWREFSSGVNGVLGTAHGLA